MRLYVVQHGQAVAKDVDPQRPLSERGRADVERMASFLGGAGIRVPRIMHSGKKRAEQTAALLAGAVGSGQPLEATSGIDPLDPTDGFTRTVSRWTEDTMVVGHLPFMGRLVSRLVVGDEAAATVGFQPGTIVCLERGEEGSWLLAWMVRPELLADRG